MVSVILTWSGWRNIQWLLPFLTERMLSNAIYITRSGTLEMHGFRVASAMLIHYHNSLLHLKVWPTSSSVAGKAWHTPAHSLRDELAHLHRTTSPSASETAVDVLTYIRYGIHRWIHTHYIHRYLNTQSQAASLWLLVKAWFVFLAKAHA